jgi:hypothetical protein
LLLKGKGKEVRLLMAIAQISSNDNRLALNAFTFFVFPLMEKSEADGYKGSRVGDKMW